MWDRIAKFFFQKVNPRIIDACIIGSQRKQFSKIASFSNSVTFYRTTRLDNRQSDPSKIFIDSNSHIKGELMTMGYGGSINIGKYSYVGEYSHIWSGDKVIIGNYVLISHNVNIIDTNSHEIDYLKRARDFRNLIDVGPASTKNSIKTKPIEILDYVWINFNATILKGVKIGKGAIISPNSLVMEDVPDFSLVGGNPAKVIRKL